MGGLLQSIVGFSMIRVMILYLVPMSRSWSLLSISTKINTKNVSCDVFISSGVASIGAKGGRVPPLTVKNMSKIKKMRGKIGKKRKKLGKNREKGGKIGKVLSLCPLLTNRAGNATVYRTSYTSKPGKRRNLF